MASVLIWSRAVEYEDRADTLERRQVLKTSLSGPNPQERRHELPCSVAIVLATQVELDHLRMFRSADCPYPLTDSCDILCSAITFQYHSSIWTRQQQEDVCEA